MVYSEVIQKGWDKLLSKKCLYTMRDVHKIKEELSKQGTVVTDKQSMFIVTCIAISNGAEVSKYIEEHI